MGEMSHVLGDITSDSAVPPIQVPMRRVRGARRADWRFLLPDIPPQRVAVMAPANGEPDHLLAAALRDDGTDVRTMAVSELPPAETHDRDLIVISEIDADSIGWAAAAAAPESILYVELRRRPWMWFRSPRSVNAQLRRSGFEPVAVHWHQPDHEHPLQIVPLASPEAVIAALRRQGRVSALTRGVSILLVRLHLFDRVAWPLSITARWMGPH
jgi:hypothetical protein